MARIIEKLKWWIAAGELQELARWRVNWDLHRRFLSENSEISQVLDNIKNHADGRESVPITRLLEEIQAQRTAQKEQSK